MNRRNIKCRNDIVFSRFPSVDETSRRWKRNFSRWNIDTRWNIDRLRSARDKFFLSVLKHQRFRFKDPFPLSYPTVKRIVVLSLIKLGDSYKISFRSCISKLKGSRKLRPVPPFPSSRNIPYVLSWDRF